MNKGLNNIGNSCYLNSLIQSLISCSSFTDRLRCANSINTQNTNENIRLKTLLNTIVTDNDLSNFVKVLPWYVNITPECVHEALTKLIDSCGIQDLFRIRFKKEVRCGCGIQNLGFDTDMIFICDNNFSKAELCHNKSMGDLCDKCGKHIEHYRKLMYLSNIIAVAFNKFNGKKLLDFPKDIVFRHKTESGNEVPLVYHLRSVIEHAGSNTIGHYYAYVKRGSSWFIANDDMFIDAQEPTPRHDSYVLLYEN